MTSVAQVQATAPTAQPAPKLAAEIFGSCPIALSTSVSEVQLALVGGGIGVAQFG